MTTVRGSGPLIAVVGLLLIGPLRASGQQQCSNESFSIGYNGVTAFEVSNVDNSCHCRGAVTSDTGFSRVDTLSVNQLTVVGAANMPCPSSCQLQTATQDARIAAQDAAIAALNSSMLALRLEVANLLAQGCSSSGGGGGGGGSSFCPVVRPTDGYVVGQPTRVTNAATVTYACNAGFNLTGFATQTCVGGGFDHDLPICVPLPCNGVAPANGGVSSALVQSGGTITYSCNVGYAMNGTVVQNCYATRFNSSVPNCIGLPCTAVAPNDGNVSSPTVPHAGSVSYSCLSGYTISGPSVRTCTATVLSGSQPVCNGNPCTLPSLPSGSSSSPSSGTVAHGSSVVYACLAGYTFSAGNLTRGCFAGVLNGVPPTCTPNPCTTSAPANGTVTATFVPHGGSVTYSCTPYTLVGTATQTCFAGSMSSTVPVCVPVPPSYRNCLHIKQTVPSSSSGTYTIDPDGTSGPGPQISVYCDMTTDGGGWASIFTLAGSMTLGSPSCLFSYNNDDHDSTILWMDLTCKVSSQNADNTDAAKYFTVTRSISAQQTGTALSPRPAVNINARPCPLPGSQRVVWFDWQAQVLNWGTGSATFASAGLSPYASCYQYYWNNYYLISDSVDMILTGCPGVANAALLQFNFVTNTVTSQTATGFLPQSGNWLGTEEDEFGDVLFTVNGKIFYYNTAGRFALGGTLANPNVLTAQYTVSSPGGDSQQQNDMGGFVDTSGYLWLADWGHDNGGYFACGNDNYLGVGQTNIRLTY